MSQVLARFRLDEVRRSSAFYKKPEVNDQDPQYVESAYVTLNAVQGEPFGAYTPSGKMEMLIVNPAASKIFFESKIGQEFDILISPKQE